MAITTDQPVTVYPDLFTIIIQFDVDAETGEAFIADLTEAVGKTIVHLPGFRGAVFQLSRDGTRVVNYAQWDSAEVYYASMATIEASQDLVSQTIAQHRARVAHAETYRVDATFAAASGPDLI